MIQAFEQPRCTITSDFMEVFSNDFSEDSSHHKAEELVVMNWALYLRKKQGMH
jgi:hypothetical protein